MISHVNWWNVGGLLVGLIGSVFVFYYALRSQRIEKFGSFYINPDISTWWFNIGIGLVTNGVSL